MAAAAPVFSASVCTDYFDFSTRLQLCDDALSSSFLNLLSCFTVRLAFNSDLLRIVIGSSAALLPSLSSGFTPAVVEEAAASSSQEYQRK